jgi:mRNA interferase RelE/StbE
LNDKWRYRIGDYRILAKIDDGLVTITVVEVGHRSDTYE